MSRRLAIALSCLGTALVGCSSGASSPDDIAPTEKPAKPPPVVPDVTGLDAADASDELEGEGFINISFEPDPLTDGAGCTVLDQEPAGGERAEEETDVSLTLDCRQVDWENQEGDDWEAYTGNYSGGFNDGCIALFNDAGSEPLYDDDPTNEYSAPTEYSLTDCTLLESGPQDIPPEVPDDPAGQGYNDGFSDGCNALFDYAGISLYMADGTEIYSYQCDTGAGTAVPGE